MLYVCLLHIYAVRYMYVLHILHMYLLLLLQVRINARPSFRLSANSHIAIDDISFDKCSPSVVSNQPLNCNFDSGNICFWYQQPNNVDNFDWTLTNNTSPTRGTGPNRDHTSGKGKSIAQLTSIYKCLVKINLAPLTCVSLTFVVRVHCMYFSYFMVICSVFLYTQKHLL